MTVTAQEKFEKLDAPRPAKRDICIWPTQGFKEITFRSIEVESKSAGEYPSILSDWMYEPGNERRVRRINWALLEDNMINGRREFRPFRKQIKLEVDWRKEKITFYTNSTTYKFGNLESDYLLMGVSISEDGKTLCLGYRSAFYGVCQGICQQPEWFSYGSATYAIVIPNTVEKIITTSCHFGPDCSEIP